MNIKQFLPARRRQMIFIAALLMVTLFNIIKLYKENKTIRQLRKVMPHQPVGREFAGLAQFTQGMRTIGYITDEDVAKNDGAHKLFAHAQFMLAPSILDLNNLDHEFLLFVYSDEKQALETIRRLNAQPLKRNPFGMILARNPGGKR